MDSITKITEQVYVCGDPCYSINLQEDLDLIYSHDMVVIDVRSDDEHRDGWDEIVGDRADTMLFPLHDDGRDNDYLDFVDLWSELVDAGFEDRTFMIHCHMGVNRAPSVAMFVLMVREGMTPVQAFNAIRKRRTGAGIAYGDLAVLAAAEVVGRTESQARLASISFNRWQRRYWEKHTHESVYSAIAANRQRTGMRGGTWIDETGLIHATR